MRSILGRVDVASQERSDDTANAALENNAAQRCDSMKTNIHYYILNRLRNLKHVEGIRCNVLLLR